MVDQIDARLRALAAGRPADVPVVTGYLRFRLPGGDLRFIVRLAVKGDW